MYQFLVLHSLSIDQILGQPLSGVTEPLGTMMCCATIKIYLWDKSIFCRCSLWYL